MNKKKKWVCIFQKQFREDLSFWVKTNRKVALRVLNLVEDTVRDPYQGIGKPESLKHIPGNVWSRRITLEDRLVYRVYEIRLIFYKLDIIIKCILFRQQKKI